MSQAQWRFLIVTSFSMLLPTVCSCRDQSGTISLLLKLLAFGEGDWCSGRRHGYEGSTETHTLGHPIHIRD